MTFADGSPNFLDAAKRLAEQVDRLKIFNKILILNKDELGSINESFSKAMEELEKLGQYPIYFQAGKTYSINSVLSGHFGKFEIVMYADPGCEIVSNFVTKIKLKNYFKKAMECGGLAEQLELAEWKYSKSSLLEYSNLSYSERASGQYQATFSIWFNCEKSIQLSELWCNWSNPKMNLWQNPEDNSLEHIGFVAHRRDQSIMSVLWKKFNFCGIPLQRNYNSGHDFLLGSIQPIHTIRNRTGEAIIPNYYNSSLVALLGLVANLFRSIIFKIIRVSRKIIEPPSGIEPETFALRERRSTD